MASIPEGFEIVSTSSDSLAPELPEGFEVVGSESGVSFDDYLESIGYEEAPQRSEDSKTSIAGNIAGAGETGLSLITGVTGGMAGHIGGAVEGILKEIVAGDFGSQEAADRIEQLAIKRAQQLTYSPRTEESASQLKSIGEFLQPLESIPPIAQAQVIASAARPAAQQALHGTKAAYAAASPEVLRLASEISSRVKQKLPESSVRSVGAAETSPDYIRAQRSKMMPVPFEGESALTKGQATGNFEQLQFEKEIAKSGELGGPIRQRSENQVNTLISNLDAISDMSNPSSFEYRDIGRNIDKALINRHSALKRKERALYEVAEKNGEMRENVKLSNPSNLWDALDDMEDTATNAASIKRIALKRGILSQTDDGVVANDVPLAQLERFRQFVNDATDITSPKESRVRAMVISAIDESTEMAGGDAYKTARKFSSRMRREFENTGITKNLLSNKRGSDERKIAYEDAFKKIMLDSPIEEINKLRGTLLKSGDEGKQAWADLKAKGIEYIKENASSKSESLEGGAPVISVNKLNKVIQSLDESGKLDSIYGKRNAQVLRDLGEISKDIMTAPPGSVNFSNTASALKVVLDSVATGAVSGVPLPVVTALKEASSKIKNARTRRRIRQSLDYLAKEQNK